MTDRTTVAAIAAWVEDISKDALVLQPAPGTRFPLTLAVFGGNSAIELYLAAPYTLLVTAGMRYTPSHALTAHMKSCIQGAARSTVAQLTINEDGFNKGVFGRGVILSALRALVESSAQTGQLLVQPDFQTNPTLGGNAREIILVYTAPDQACPTSVRLHASAYQTAEMWRR